MATDPRRMDALQFIFSLFLGLLLVVVIGVGVWTFYPGPDREDEPRQKQIQQLYREQERFNMKQGSESMDTTEQAEFDRITGQIDKLNEDIQKDRSRWAVNTSIILLAFATILMAVSLFLPEHMRVFSNGILLGGLFSVLYGTGWSFAGGNSKARFYVVLAALLLSVIFGYLRFIRGRQAKELAASQISGASPGAGSETPVAQPALTSLAARVEELERRTDAAARALGSPDKD